ncbi:MAG TPA: ATPase domain-containing protein [Polyangia bacterium]
MGKAPTGIAGLDAVLRGGLPRGRTTVIFGGTGSGKTILALRLLVNGARESDERGIFVAFEEPPAQIAGNAAPFGWDLPSLQARFISWIKTEGITLVNACLISGSHPATEATDLGLPTLCDTWIHVSYAPGGGERNRAITVIKARGPRHSNQIRELILDDEGVDLAPTLVTVAPGPVRTIIGDLSDRDAVLATLDLGTSGERE